MQVCPYKAACIDVILIKIYVYFRKSIVTIYLLPATTSLASRGFVFEKLEKSRKKIEITPRLTSKNEIA